MNAKRFPIIRFTVDEALSHIVSGELTLQKRKHGSAELLGGSKSMGVNEHIYAIGWLSAKQVALLEQLLARAAPAPKVQIFHSRVKK